MIISEKDFKELKEIMNSAQWCLIYTGAGMGADSGLDVFRGTDGLWNKYPKARDLNLSFEKLANPNNYLKHNDVVYPFYRDRHEQYLNAEPHSGFYELFGFVETLPHGYFLITSNVDSLFQKAGFKESNIYEIHGNLNYWQCSNFNCANKYGIEGLKKIDKKMSSTPLVCNHCGSLLRPNICMFYDADFINDRYFNQSKKFEEFYYKKRNSNVAIIEIGAGNKIASIRADSTMRAFEQKTKVIRINPNSEIGDFDDPNVIFLEASAKEGISFLMDLIEKK